jgi:hypothetical protein
MKEKAKEREIYYMVWYTLNTGKAFRETNRRGEREREEQFVTQLCLNNVCSIINLLSLSLPPTL